MMTIVHRFLASPQVTQQWGVDSDMYSIVKIGDIKQTSSWNDAIGASNARSAQEDGTTFLRFVIKGRRSPAEDKEVALVDASIATVAFGECSESDCAREWICALPG